MADHIRIFLEDSSDPASEFQVCYSADMTDLVLLDIHDRVATVTLNRPEQRNALSQALMNDLEETFSKLVQTDDLCAVILQGAGPVFCAGIDLEDISRDQEQAVHMVQQLGLLIRHFRRLPPPTIVVVQGTAIGAGCALMLAADFIITHSDVNIGYPPRSSLLSPAIIAPWLTQRIGPSQARAQLLFGGSVNGQEAFGRGMITHLVETDRLQKTADELADQFRQGSSTMTAQLKYLLNELDGSMDDEALDMAMKRSAESVAQRVSTADSGERDS